MIQAAWLTPLAALVLVGFLFVSVSRVARVMPSQSAGPAAEIDWPTTADRAAPWEVFQGGPQEKVVSGGPLSNRFRLAGTFVAYGALTDDKRKAILDDLRAGSQVVVDENDTVVDVQVARIYRDHVLLRCGGVEEELWLSFRGSERVQRGGVVASGTNNAADNAGEAPLPFNGKRVGEYRWVFGREALLDYYSTLRDEPERLVAVFDSLEPVYADGGNIEGYRVNIKGEKEFFDAVGLVQGDVVRAVNTMQMTNRRRAEYFIREFIYDRANAFVLDVERGGQPTKLTYQVR